MMPYYRSLSENSRGILFMLATMTSFILSDTFVKLASADISVAQIILVRSLIAVPVIVLIGLHQGVFSMFRLSERFIWLRGLGEVGATALYLTALAHMEIANATAIIQMVPLAATLAAALFLGERVGIRRWSAVAIGLFAVLLIIRPGFDGFTGWSLLALASVGFIVLRDVSSRFLPVTSHPLAVSSFSLFSMIPLGLLMLSFESWEPLTFQAVLFCAGSAFFLSASFVLITHAMRHGEISVISPFRYAIMLWAVIIQIVVFSVWPDVLTLVGSVLLVATGIYTLGYERKRKTEAILKNGVRAPGAPHLY